MYHMYEKFSSHGEQIVVAIVSGIGQFICNIACLCQPYYIFFYKAYETSVLTFQAWGDYSL